MLYFDHAASSPLREEVAQTFFEAVRRDVGNPSSQHRLGRSLNREIEDSRGKIVRLFGSKEKTSLVFTSSATESNNHVIAGVGQSLREKGQKFIAFKGDHVSLTAPLEKLQEEDIEGEFLFHPPRDLEGKVDWQSFFKQRALEENVGLLVLSHVNGQSGDLLPLEELLPLLRERYPQAHIHVDAVQSFGKSPVGWENVDVESLSFSSHKLGGPKGVAALVLKNSAALPPLLRGGAHEQGQRASTPCFSLIKGFHKAIESSLKELESEAFSEAMKKKEFLQKELSRALEKKVSFPFSHEQSSPYILTVIIQGPSSDILIRHLEERDVFLSSSSACSSRQKNYHPSFEALGIDPKDHPHVLRISFVPETTTEEMQNLVKHLTDVIEDLEFLFK